MLLLNFMFTPCLSCVPASAIFLISVKQLNYTVIVGSDVSQMTIPIDIYEAGNTHYV